MNDIKQRYPFVDLLKPETQAVIPILLALDPKAAVALKTLPGLVARQQVARAQIAAGLLGDDAPMSVGAASGAIDAGGPALARMPRSAVSVSAREIARSGARIALMDLAESDFIGGRAALDLVDAAGRTETLGWGSALWTLATGGDRVEALRAQLKELADDRSFSTVDLDDTFRGLNAKISTNIDFLVTGHTHLARAFEREFGRSYYFNTGTWARVFRIDPVVLSHPDEFRKLFAALGSNRINALDTATGLLAVRPHFAAF